MRRLSFPSTKRTAGLPAFDFSFSSAQVLLVGVWLKTGRKAKEEKIICFEGEGFPASDPQLARGLLQLLSRRPEQLPLESFCEEGGWPGPWQAHIDEIRKNEAGALVILSVSFVERVSACCDLGSVKEELGYHEIPRYGQMEIRIESSTGRMTLRPLP